MSKTIIIIQGPTGSGKSTLMDKLNIPRLPIYTTRKKRDLLDNDYVFIQNHSDIENTRDIVYQIETPVGEYYYMEPTDDISIVSIIETTVAKILEELLIERGHIVHYLTLAPSHDLEEAITSRNIDECDRKHRSNLLKQVIINGPLETTGLQGFKVDFKVNGDDCKSTGFPMTITKKFVKPIAFLYISVDQKPYTRYSASELYSMMGKTVRVRTPLYCKQPGKEICKKCAGDALQSALLNFHSSKIIDGLFKRFKELKGDK